MEIHQNDIETLCLLCGGELMQLSQTLNTICSFCNNKFDASETCIENHYICEKCKQVEPIEIVKTICLKSTKTDPIDLAKEVMRSPAIKMFGEAHHIITPAVLLTAVSNFTNKFLDLEKKIEEVRKIVDKLAPSCQWHLGSCGSALGASIFFILWTGSDPEDEASWDKGNVVVANSLKRIAEFGSPRCCKRDTYITIEETVDFLKRNYNLNLPISEPKCDFSLRNRTCKREDCIYFNLKFSLV
ncbi:MAG: DUF5714 domain-containing protein [Ignavibacteria bacterium]|nr:DUF5714 domain-containing protein [Ignavibacteria bacterium]